jgi:REP element-mobilizing transposase RayT
MVHQPLYIPGSCNAAYQLRWSLALFPSQRMPPCDEWLEPLRLATERDDVRILEYHELTNSVVFLLSTVPATKPPAIVKSVKGRLTHALRDICTIDFRRNFRLTAVGDAKSAEVENYVARQLDHHRLASHVNQDVMREFTIRFDDVDLRSPVNSSHGQYVLALHVVLVHAARWRTAERAFLLRTQNAILTTARKKMHRISRLSLLPDHLHFTLKFTYEMSPQDVVLPYMKNIAFLHGMSPVLMESYYAGTIGPYDMNAVRRG